MAMPMAMAAVAIGHGGGLLPLGPPSEHTRVFEFAKSGAWGEHMDQVSKVFFHIVHVITKVAPIGAFGAMAFTIGKYGLGSLIPLLKLIGTFYFTAIVFVLVVLGTVARLIGFSIIRFVAYIKEELLIVLGTSSSEQVVSAGGAML